MKRKFVTPFKTPFKNPEKVPEESKPSSESSAKKTSSQPNPSQESKPGTSTTTSKKFTPPTKTKLVTEAPASSETNASDEGEVWSVMHTKNTTKKHKTFDDGFLLIKNKRYTLFDSQGKQLLAKPIAVVETFKEGDQMTLGSKLLEINNKIKMDDYTSGRIFLQYQSNITKTKVVSKAATTKFKSHSTTKAAGLG